MNPAKLKVTQRSIRHHVNCIPMFRHIAENGLFDSPRKIALIDTGDGNLWIRDGLHRCCGIFWAGREIHESEYIIEKFTYEQMSQPNLSVKYYTPFDLRTEVRLEDFFDYKLAVEKLETEEDKLVFIQNNAHLYKTRREQHHNSIQEFYQYIRNVLCYI